MKCAIIGGRDFNDYEKVVEVLSKYNDITEIISGGAKGADSLAEKYAQEKNIPLTIFPANWKKYGKSAGVIRNRDIVKNSDILFSFWDGKSKGTANSIALARKSNKSVVITYY